jgi:N-dimethylarginine dimethylaminohydrolase
VRERGVEPVVVDVSEFLKKGGGSVKCMIGDLGPVEA